MADPLGLIQPGPLQPMRPGAPGAGGPHEAAPQPGVPSFKSVLAENLAKVNELQRDATHAVEDLQAGRRHDLETVLLATQKADTAFRMMLSVRNKLMDAYAEIQQIRV